MSCIEQYAEPGKLISGDMQKDGQILGYKRAISDFLEDSDE
jgi:hypothetical protein